MDVRIHESWKRGLEAEFNKPYFAELADFVKREYKSKIIYPPPADIFRAFDLCPLNQVRVVIVGQDPYHGSRQAHGLCFSVNDSVPTPPSLQNIFQEIHDDLGKQIPQTGNLEKWAHQGVLLLNATLTVAAGQAASHRGKGWEEFTDAVINVLSEECEDLVFLLWGRYAQEKGSMIDQSKHLVLSAAHPSPLSAHSGFFGCKHFSKTNEYLKSRGEKAIEW